MISPTSSDADIRLKVALPKGALTGPVADLLERAGIVVPGYHDGSRVYRLVSQSPPGVFVKVFSPRDIPIQVAVGNYDIGVSDRLWVDELITSYRKIALVVVMELGFGHERLYAASTPDGAAGGAFVGDVSRSGEDCERISEPGGGIRAVDAVFQLPGFPGMGRGGVLSPGGGRYRGGRGARTRRLSDAWGLNLSPRSSRRRRSSSPTGSRSKPGISSISSLGWGGRHDKTGATRRTPAETRDRAL